MPIREKAPGLVRGLFLTLILGRSHSQDLQGRAECWGVWENLRLRRRFPSIL
jgi:hypothetical protein